MTESYSQAKQDVFVSHVLKNLKNGFFIDIGCGDPIGINNSYFLESELEWDGICIDISDQDYSNRKAKFYNKSALDIDYKEFFKENNVPKVIDYLSLDIDCPYTLDALKLIVKATKHEYKVITIEHDWYQLEDRLIYREEQREILEGLGYKRLASDVYLNDHEYFEDWWINPKYIDINEFSYLQCDKTHCDEIASKIVNR
jgi:arginyl-tRNA synthetase